MKQPRISCDYSRLPGALLPAVTFMAAAALLHTAASYVFTGEAGVFAGALVTVPAVVLFRFLYGPVFLLKTALPGDGAYTGVINPAEEGRHRSLLKATVVLAAFSGAVFCNILLAMLVPAAFFTTEAGGKLHPAAMAAAFCLIAPACEELIFRCHLYPVLRRILGETAGVLLSAALFGLYHADLVQGLYAACMGTILCLCHRFLGGFAGAFTVHAAVNLLMLILSKTGAFGGMIRPAFLASSGAVFAVSLYMHFYLRRVLHL